MTYKKARPQTLRVMGRNYEVIFEKENSFKSSSAGLCDNQKMIITIMEEQHPAEELDTIIHELLHAIWHHMSMGEHPPEEADHSKQRPSEHDQIGRIFSSALLALPPDRPFFCLEIKLEGSTPGVQRLYAAGYDGHL